MNLTQLVSNVKKTIGTNSPEILTGLGIVGVISTAYLTGRASYKSALVIQKEEEKHGTHSDAKERFKERSALVWKLYVPPAISGVATIGCIFGVSHITSRRAAAAAAAYAVAERSLNEYRDKVEEDLGKTKDQKVRDAVAQDRVENNPPTETFVIDSSHVLCCELYTGRYFTHDVESLKRAAEQINERIQSDLYVMLSEFYDLIGIPNTSQSDYLGWESGKPMELRFSAVATKDNRPCMAFDYSYIRPLR